MKEAWPPARAASQDASMQSRRAFQVVCGACSTASNMDTNQRFHKQVISP
jgi:hypothetical protein